MKGTTFLAVTAAFLLGIAGGSGAFINDTTGGGDTVGKQGVYSLTAAATATATATNTPTNTPTPTPTP